MTIDGSDSLVLGEKKSELFSRETFYTKLEAKNISRYFRFAIKANTFAFLNQQKVTEALVMNN